MSKLVYVIDVEVPEDSSYEEVLKVHKSVQDVMRAIKFKNTASIHVNESAEKVLKAATK